jgi:hypothetical protein
MRRVVLLRTGSILFALAALGGAMAHACARQAPEPTSPSAPATTVRASEAPSAELDYFPASKAGVFTPHRQKAPETAKK